MGSCVVPENITQYVPPTTHSPPVITAVTPTGVITCIDDHHPVTHFTVNVSDDAAAADQIPLQLRWFVDYSYDPSAENPIVLPGAVFPTNQGTSVGYTSGDIGSDFLLLSVHGVGYHTLDVAITDEFNIDGTVAPRNRAPGAGSYVTSFKWVINYLGQGNCPD